MGFSFGSFLNPVKLAKKMFSGDTLSKAVNLPNKIVGEGVAGVAGRNTWLGRRAAGFGKPSGTSFMDLSRDFLASNMGAIQHIQKNRETDATIKAEKETGQIAAANKAAHDAEVARLAENSLGAVAIRRRKGMYASMFTGTPTLSAPNTGKVLLSQ